MYTPLPRKNDQHSMSCTNARVSLSRLFLSLDYEYNDFSLARVRPLRYDALPASFPGAATCALGVTVTDGHATHGDGLLLGTFLVILPKGAPASLCFPQQSRTVSLSNST